MIYFRTRDNKHNVGRSTVAIDLNTVESVFCLKINKRLSSVVLA